MKQVPFNPQENNLGAGLIDSDVVDAVRRSGYPLQTVVGDRLQRDFSFMQDEWGYVDRDSGDLRALDLAAERPLWGPEQPRVRPELNLLVECKQSELPYVFFVRNDGSALVPPLVVGGRGTRITLSTDDDRSTYNMGLLGALGLDLHDFAVKAPRAITLSRTARRGKVLELSGSDAYTGLLLPLLKAMLFFEKTRSGPPKWYSDLHLVIAIAVLDAPMIGVSLVEEKTEFELMPWIRVARHESYDTTSPFEQQRLFTVDFVHRSFLDAYLSAHLLPYAEEFGRRVVAQQSIIIAGKGYATGLSSGSLGDPLYETLRERPPRDTARRFWHSIRY